MQATGVGMVEGSQLPGPSGPGGFLDALRRPYRAGQGVLTRRIAYWAGVGLVLWAARDLWVWLRGFPALQKSVLSTPVAGVDLSRIPLGGPELDGAILIAAGVAVLGWVWVSWFVKRPWLADLLIDTESEMKKVSWPARDEAWAAAKVVTVTVIVFTAVLTVFDFVITGFMKMLTGLPL
jgi:preprotein translocase SecE subunit